MNKLREKLNRENLDAITKVVQTRAGTIIMEKRRGSI